MGYTILKIDPLIRIGALQTKQQKREKTLWYELFLAKDFDKKEFGCGYRIGSFCPEYNEEKTQYNPLFWSLPVKISGGKIEIYDSEKNDYHQPLLINWINFVDEKFEFDWEI